MDASKTGIFQSTRLDYMGTTRDLQPGFPIFSLSWGSPQRFLVRARENHQDMKEVLLEDGDLLVVVGTCQQTHKHEVPKVRVTMDPVATERINWTIRAFREKPDQPVYLMNNLI